MPSSAPVLPPCLAALERARMVTFGPVGAAALRPPELEAYEIARQLARKDAAIVRPGIEWLLREGAPAARVYAALLLKEMDPDRAARAFARWRVTRRRSRT